MSLRMRSSAWLFFDKTSDPSIAKCSICGASIKSYSSTTNLLKHLRSRHFEETSAEINWDTPAAGHQESLTDEPDGEASETLDEEGCHELSSSLNVSESLAMRSNRSPVWFCFTRIKENNIAKCKFCSVSLRYDSSSGTSGLIKHFMRKHEHIYQKIMAQMELHKEQEEADDGVELEYSEFKECLDPTDSAADVSSDVAALFQEDSDDLAAVVHEVAMSQLVNSTDQRKTTRSLAWACFSRVGDSDVSVCKYCRMVVKTEGGSTSNMLSHFLRRHGVEYERAKAKRGLAVDEITEQQAEDKANDDVDNPNSSSQEDSFLAELVSNQRSHRLTKSIVWACFVKKSDGRRTENGSTEHECIHCGAFLKSEHGTTSSMMAHFMKQHPVQYKAAISSRSAMSKTKSSLMRKYFTQLTRDDWSCSFCERLLRQPGCSVSNLVKHLMTKHSEEYKLIISELSSPANAVYVKTEEVYDDLDDASDSLSNGVTAESAQPPQKRQKHTSSTAESSSDSPLLKVSGLWRRHVEERQREHGRQTSALKLKLSKLQDSMKKIKEEISAVHGELSRTEDSWKKETVRHKEVNRQFQSALKSSVTRRSVIEDTSTGDTAGALAMHVDDGDWSM